MSLINIAKRKDVLVFKGPIYDDTIFYKKHKIGDLYVANTTWQSDFLKRKISKDDTLIFGEHNEWLLVNEIIPDEDLLDNYSIKI